LEGLQKIKNPNKRLILFLGIPGAGKTTLAHIIKDSVPNTILLRGLGIFGIGKDQLPEKIKRQLDKDPLDPDGIITKRDIPPEYMQEVILVNQGLREDLFDELLE